MKSFLQKDQKNRKIVKFFETKRFILKSIIKNTNLSHLIRLNAICKLTFMTKKSSKVCLVNNCMLTGRKSKIHYSYKFSRLVFLKFVRFGKINGLKKSKW